MTEEATHVSALSLRQMAALYNERVPPERRVKKFGSRDVAERRLEREGITFEGHLRRSTRQEGVSPARGKNLGITQTIRDYLGRGEHTPKEIAALVREQFPLSRATVSDVYVTRRRMKEEQEADS